MGTPNLQYLYEVLAASRILWTGPWIRYSIPNELSHMLSVSRGRRSLAVVERGFLSAECSLLVLEFDAARTRMDGTPRHDWSTHGGASACDQVQGRLLRLDLDQAARQTPIQVPDCTAPS